MNDFINTVVIIPSYNPPQTLPGLCLELLALGFKHVVVVNDGSPKHAESIFKEVQNAGCFMVHLEKNEGKGSALRQGIRYAVNTFPECSHFVFCDDDGQHSPTDVAKVSQQGIDQKSDFVIGVRDISQMPLKSYVGNQIMCLLLKYFHRLDIPDTQSGLRFITKDYASLLLTLNQERFSFELMSLLRLHQKRVSIGTCPIQTIYFEKNRSTRFMAVVDSMDVVKSSFFSRDETKDSKK